MVPDLFLSIVHVDVLFILSFCSCLDDGCGLPFFRLDTSEYDEVVVLEGKDEEVAELLGKFELKHAPEVKIA